MKKSGIAAILATVIGACTGGAAIASWKLDRLPDDANDDKEEKSEEKTDEGSNEQEDSAPETEDNSEEK